MNQTYEDFLQSKIKVAERHGIDVDPALLHASLRPDQRDIAAWALGLGKALIAPDAGCGKTRIAISVLDTLQKEFGGRCLIVTELGASDTFVDNDPEVGEGAAMGIKLQYVANQHELDFSPCKIAVTNYERIRNGEFDFSKLTAVWLDEGNYVKNMASETTDSIKRELAKVRYKYIATATPSPNETLELVNYAHVLGICDRGQILTRFFQRNSTKAGELTLHPHHTDDFWLWVKSWCIAITSPADLGYNYEGFALPKLNLHWIEVKAKPTEAPPDKDGQGKMFINSRSGLSEAAKIKRNSIDDRINAGMQIIGQYPEDHFILWHHLNDELAALNKTFKGNDEYGCMYGAMNWQVREKRIVDFTKGNLKYLATKPEISGVGCNFQKHCNKSIFFGINDSFDSIYQAIKRIYRFYQPSEQVDVWLLYTPEEYDIVLNIQRKWKEHDEMRTALRDLILEYGLDHKQQIEERKRSFMVERVVYTGDNYELINTDAVYEWKQRPTDSIDLIVSSFPFGNHYEYTDKYNDFGHNENNQSFIRQLSYLLPELHRCLKPGRIAAVHLKNRIHYGSVTGLGFSIFHRFTHMVCDAMEAAGFHTMGFHYIPTDVVAENNQTYRLGYSEACKDATKMGAGIPEEIWIFRKAPSSNANAYADVPVIHNPAQCSHCKHVDTINEYKVKGGFKCPSCNVALVAKELILLYGEGDKFSLSHWQLDADAFWKSNGNSLLTPQQLKAWGIDKIQQWWKRFNADKIYNYDEHVKLLQALDEAGKLSRTFTTIPLRSNTEHIWNDVNRMHGLNMEQSRRKLQNHICPMPFDEVERLIEFYSMPGETVADPFGGICTTGVVALKKKRKVVITELNELYAQTGNMYMKETEIKNNLPTLFDLLQEPKKEVA